MSLFNHNYKQYLRDTSFLISVLGSFLLLAVSFYINFHAGRYADSSESGAVTDIILSNIPVFDVDSIFIYGPIIFWIFVTFICFIRPHRIPFTIKSLALFIIIRSIFVSLTHIGQFPTHIVIDTTNIFNKISFGGDLFFSGHTGLPYLMALVFWENKYLRILFFIISLIFGAIVLMGHLHYSIDVFGAFFITYSIYKIAERLFKKDKKVFNSGIPQSL